MSFISAPPMAADQLANLRRLIALRWGALVLMAALILLLPDALAIPLPTAPLLAMIGITALFNGAALWRAWRADAAAPVELFSQLCLDIAVLSALLFFSGGATNPLVSLLLPPVAIAALTLPARLRGGRRRSQRSPPIPLLMVIFVPLPMIDAARATRLHLVGMWLTFVVSVALIAWFVVRMTRRSASATPNSRPRANRRCATSACSPSARWPPVPRTNSGTPLATMVVLAGELDARSAAHRRPCVTTSTSCASRSPPARSIITGLSRRAGAERLENPGIQPVDRWLDTLRQRWHALRPQAQSRLEVTGAQPAPVVVADPRLEQAILNLLNNAASASVESIDIRLGWTAERIAIEIHDFGPGFPAGVLTQGGRVEFPAHEHGSGIGLMLTRSAIEQIGGRLLLHNPPAGGALARLELTRGT